MLFAAGVEGSAVRPQWKDPSAVRQQQILRLRSSAAPPHSAQDDNRGVGQFFVGLSVNPGLPHSSPNFHKILTASCGEPASGKQGTVSR